MPAELMAWVNSKLSDGVGSMNQPWPSALVSIVMCAGDDSWPTMLPERSAMLKVVACNAASWLAEAPASAHSAIAAATTEFNSAMVR